MEKCSTAMIEENEYRVSLLDLPNSMLASILECLSPSELCRVATVCTFLRDICRRDHLWEKLMKQKWGRVIGNVAHREWQRYVALWKTAKLMGKCNPFESSGSFHGDWPILTIGNSWHQSTSLPDDSSMAWCISLESGRFWFPAQLYDEDNAGKIMYWRDALLSYNFRTDTFQARYPHDRWQKTKKNIKWDKVRAPVVDDSPYVVHISDCLSDLKPGDHIEIQWRCKKSHPYDWRRAVIGHLQSCNSHWTPCSCCYSDALALVYSLWQRAELNRKNCNKEQGDGVDGYYGGIRRLLNEETARSKET